MAADQLWTLAAMIYLSMFRITGDNLTPGQSNHLREALFNSAKDPQAKSIFSKNQNQPVFLIDPARFQLYLGDPD